MTEKDFYAKMSAPFAASDVEWRVSSTTKDKSKGLAVPYIDSRAIQYRLDAELWLEEVMENREYDTGIDVEFGDEILTLTTCLYQRENGRFVVVARRVRDGEVIE